MEELKEYLTYQIEHLEKWDKSTTLSEYGKGKLSGFKNILEQLLIQDVSNRFKEEQFITNTCFSYRHDYGLMLNKDKDKLRFECSEWMRAIKNSETH